MTPNIQSRRRFITTTTAATVALAAAPQWALGQSTDTVTGTPMTQPPLPYGYADLEAAIDAQTMELHYSKHHAGYVRKFQAAWGDRPRPSSVEAAIARFDASTDAALRNNGGGHANHTLFWDVMAPAGSAPISRVPSLEAELADAFGSFAEFRKAFAAQATSVFGSGWAWLCVDRDGHLFLTSTPNQDNPLMADLVDRPGTPVLGLDVWEHAYYLRYQNRRGDYIDSWWDVVNWPRVAARIRAARR